MPYKRAQLLRETDVVALIALWRLLMGRGGVRGARETVDRRELILGHSHRNMLLMTSWIYGSTLRRNMLLMTPWIYAMQESCANDIMGATQGDVRSQISVHQSSES